MEAVRDSAILPPSSARNIAIPSTQQSHDTIDPLSSPTAAHAALLSRSLEKVIAERAARNSHEEGFRESRLDIPQVHLNLDQDVSGFQSPVLGSAFSDYGSSACSSAAYTPADSQIDPFEFDNEPDVPQKSHFLPPPPDNFYLFAAAIEMNSINYNFVLPSFPPKRLVERRPAVLGIGSQSAGVAEPSNKAPYDPFAESFAKAIQQSRDADVATFDNTLAARRRRSDSIAKLTGTLPSRRRQSAAENNKFVLRPVPVLRRINTDTTNYKPQQSSIVVTEEVLCPDTAATVRPRARSSTTTATTTRPLSDLFQDGPPTPVSPPSPGNTSNPQEQYLHVEHEISPPASPHDFAANIPQYLGDGSLWSSASSDSDVFGLEYFVAPPIAPPPALPSSATIGGKCFF